MVSSNARPGTLRHQSVPGSVVSRMIVRTLVGKVRAVKLSDWLDEYRSLPADGFERPVAESTDDWEEPEVLAPADRLRSTEPRWRERASRVGYGRPTQI